MSEISNLKFRFHLLPCLLQQLYKGSCLEQPVFIRNLSITGSLEKVLFIGKSISFVRTTFLVFSEHLYKENCLDNSFSPTERLLRAPLLKQLRCMLLFLCLNIILLCVFITNLLLFKHHLVKQPVKLSRRSVMFSPVKIFKIINEIIMT